MVKGRHFFFSLLASEVCSQPPSPPTSSRLGSWNRQLGKQLAFCLCLVLGAHVATLSLGMGPKWSRWTRALVVEAVAQRRGLTGAQEWGRCFSQRDLEGMCWAYSRATGSLLSCPVARVHSVHSWPGPGEEGSIYSGAHLMLPPTPTFFFFFLFLKKGSHRPG